jgi:prepilin-type N-terminal cleavage/methylation domain-containing protein
MAERGRASEAGFTLIELLVASAMGVVVLGAIGTMVIGAVRAQPEISQRAENISTARWILERFTREIRNGVVVDSSKATASEVSFRTYVRRTSCGSGVVPSTTTPAIECQVTYKCTTTYCTRGEGAPGSSTPVSEQKIFSGIDDSNVFSYSPSAAEPKYIGITLHIQNPSGPADITVSDGASLRNATLGY